jgi:hypothetical protein
MKNEWLRRHRKSMHLCTECGTPTDMRVDGSYFSMCEICREEARKEPQGGTLCWHCKNAVPNRYGTRGCSWSIHKVPVKGWDAEPTTLRFYEGHTIKSYKVKSCPNFEEG